MLQPRRFFLTCAFQNVLLQPDTSEERLSSLLATFKAVTLHLVLNGSKWVCSLGLADGTFRWFEGTRPLPIWPLTHIGSSCKYHSVRVPVPTSQRIAQNCTVNVIFHLTEDTGMHILRSLRIVFKIQNRVWKSVPY